MIFMNEAEYKIQGDYLKIFPFNFIQSKIKIQKDKNFFLNLTFIDLS